MSYMDLIMRYKIGDTVRYFMRDFKDREIVSTGIGIIVSIDPDYGFANVLTEDNSMEGFYAYDLMHVEKPIESDKTERSSKTKNDNS